MRQDTPACRWRDRTCKPTFSLWATLAKARSQYTSAISRFVGLLPVGQNYMTADWGAKFADITRRPEARTLIIILLWAWASLSNVTMPSFIWEEGTNAVIARQILTGADWLPPVVYGLREIDKPYLLAWLIAGVALVTGEVNEWSARLPVMISVLLTALLVQSVTRRYASLNASLFAALAYLFSPLLLQKLRIAEPDAIVTLLSFCAFVVWWNGVESNRMTLWRWIGCGCLLGFLTLMKGPMPLGFFALGVGAYVALERRWRDVPGLFVCMAIPAIVALAWGIAVYQSGDERTWLMVHGMVTRTWSDYLARNTRTTLSLVLELMPAILLAPFAAQLWWRGSATAPGPRIVKPLILYSVLCAGVIVFWPGFVSRYAMPIAPAVAVLGGIGWDALSRTRYGRLKWLAGGLVTICIGYQLVLVTVVIPIYADRFGATRSDGEAMERAVRAAPAPVFCTDFASNQLFYVRVPMRCLDHAALASLTAPAWLLIPQYELSQINKLRPDLKIDTVVATKSGHHLIAARAEKR
jgi:4-amino-4-deoxy-L-arabinose transferase-like glycosyltransferase